MTLEATRGGAYHAIDALPYALAVVRDRRIVHANPVLVELLGYPRECVEGSPVGKFSTEHGPLINERHERRLRGEAVPDIYEAVLNTARGERRVEFSVSRSGEDTLVMVRDLTSRAAQRQVLQQLATLGASLPGTYTEQQVLERVFAGLAGLGFSHGYFVPEAERIRLTHLFVLPRLLEPGPPLDREAILQAWSEWAPTMKRAWQEGVAHEESLSTEMYAYTSGHPNEAIRDVARRIQHLRMVCARIDAEGKPLAVLAVATDWLSEEEVPAVRLFAAQVSAALSSARTISRLSLQNTALTALNRLAVVAATAQESKDIFEPGAGELFALLACQAVGFMLYHEECQDLELLWHRGLSAQSIQGYRQFPQRALVARDVMAQSHPQMRHLEDYPNPMRELMLRSNRASLATVPLKMGSRKVGVVVILFNQRRVLSRIEQETLQAMGVHFAAAIDAHRLLLEARRRDEQLAQLHRELREAQLLLMERERLAALGELSAVLAHEVRNPLGAIFNSLATLGRRLPGSDPDTHLLLSIITEEAQRLDRLVNDLLDFARPAQSPPEPVALTRLLEEAVRAAAPGPAHVQVEWDLEPDVPPLPVDERMVRQAFLNLALNAVQAMPQGGVLRITARRRGQGALVEFTDTGSGIPPALRARLFEPFFTTKATGTGLGLAIVRRTLDAHGGCVVVESPPSGGTTFRLEFPPPPEPAGASTLRPPLRWPRSR